MPRKPHKKKQGPYATILAEIGIIKRELHNHLSAHDDVALRVELLAEKLDDLSRRFSRLEGGIALLRWGVPIVVSVALFVLGRLMT